VDFREDMAASENLMQRCAELYRKLRNTFRFLLGNLHGFDPARDRIAEGELLPLDRYMLARTRELTEKIIGPDGKTGWYGAFEFHRVYQAVNEFAIVDLSSFYLDVLKDRMYTFAPSSLARRSAQTVLWKITETLVRLVAPILTFTAEEVWEQLPPVAGREISVHLARFPRPEEIFSEDPAKLIEEWKDLFAVRDQALLVLEGERKAQRIGKGLEADLQISTTGEPLALLRRLSAADLKELFNVSNVEVLEADVKNLPKGKAIGFRDSDLALFCDIKPSPASGQKCARCWNFMPDTADYGIWHDVCGRCREALKEMGIAPPKPEAA
jgi:isoleucyl-tRNA synthetase